MNDDSFSLSKVSTDEITSIPSTELTSAHAAGMTSVSSAAVTGTPPEIKSIPSTELTSAPSPLPQVPPVDPQLALRARIEAEELAKFEEEQMRAEIRTRMTGQQAAPAPAPVIVNITNSNVSSATANVVGGGRQHPSTIIRLLYFLFFGWWIGPIWVGVAILFCLSFFGLPIGLLMLSRALDSFIL